MITKRGLNGMYKQNQKITYDKLKNLQLSYKAQNLLIVIANFHVSPLEPTISNLKNYFNDKEENIKEDLIELYQAGLIDKNLKIKKEALDI